MQGQKPLNCGFGGDRDNGNGSLMRIAPAAVFCQYKMPTASLDEKTKSMGLTQEELNSITHQMALDVSAETLKATFVEGIELYNYMEKWEPRTDIPMACWYGELVGQEELFIKEMEAFMRKNSILNRSEA